MGLACVDVCRESQCPPPQSATFAQRLAIFGWTVTSGEDPVPCGVRLCRRQAWHLRLHLQSNIYKRLMIISPGETIA